MKKFFFLAAMMFFAGQIWAQHTATLTGNANFKTTSSGLVRLEVNLDNPLTETQTAEAFNWLEENPGYCVLEVDGIKVAISFVSEFSSRDTFGKVFHLMGIDSFKVTVNNQVKTMTPEQLFYHFGM